MKELQDQAIFINVWLWNLKIHRYLVQFFNFKFKLQLVKSKCNV
jgi:hypothetical protein